MCFFSQPSQQQTTVADPAPAPVAADAIAKNPVLTNIYDPSSPEAGVAAEKGAASLKAKGTSQLKIGLDPVSNAVDKGTGLQINK